MKDKKDSVPVTHEELRTRQLTKEDEYFLRKEMDRERELARKRAEKESEAEKQRLRELHHNHCPGCGQMLVEQDFKGVRLSRCPACNGVWLDVNDLEQMAERAAQGRSKGVIARFFSILTK